MRLLTMGQRIPRAQLREKTHRVLHQTPYLALRKINKKGGKHNDSEGKEDPGYPGERYPRGRYRLPRGSDRHPDRPHQRTDRSPACAQA